MKFSRWFDAVTHCEKTGQAYVIATVLGVAGSSPRDQGSKMVITLNDETDTIGGGHLEFMVMEKARALIANGTVGNTVEHFPLGASLGQCCGGSVSVLLESFVQQGLNLTVFGAGHVGKALMTILGEMPGQVRWVDNRPDMFPTTCAGNIEMIHMPEPQDIIASLPTNSQILVLTHNHQLDFELVQLALKRNDFSYVGCIGSKTKAQRFKMRLQHRQLSPEQIEQFICPVGHLDIPGKLPIEVAVSMVGQLIQHLHRHDEKPLRQGVSWKTLKQDITNKSSPEHS